MLRTCKQLNILCVLTAPLTSCFHLSPSLASLLGRQSNFKTGLLYSLRHRSIKMRPINNPTRASKSPSERKSCNSLTWNQNRNDQAWWGRRAESQDRLKPRPFVPNSWSSCECKGKVLEGDLKCYACGHMNDKKAKQPCFWFGESFGGLDRGWNKP